MAAQDRRHATFGKALRRRPVCAGVRPPLFMVAAVMQPPPSIPVPGAGSRPRGVLPTPAAPGGYPLTMNRHAFTLVEMLVVISIISVLAGMLIPTVALVRRMARDITCGNQLQQIGGAIEVYKSENNDTFPARLLWRDNDPLAGSPITGDLFHGGGPLVGLKKILVCPRDGQNGRDVNMGRLAPGSSNWGDLSSIYTTGSSYCYEASAVYLNRNDRDFFFADLPSDKLPALNTSESTWAAGKFHQLKFGNLTGGAGSLKGAPFASSLFPLIRCYWHAKWTGNATKDAGQRRGVRNVSWDLNIFDTSPYWEHDINPDIPLP
jgi:prepilin-type N-terminal cleavage/methylation domain-containing protein